MATKVKRPLNRSIVIICAIFIGLLCIISSILLYLVYTRNMFKRYEMQLLSMFNYVERHIDHDDLSKCADTFQKSEKYEELQLFLNDLVDGYTDVHYVYIMKVSTVDDPIQIYEVCCGNTQDEIENHPEMVFDLGDGEEDWYTKKEAAKFRKIQEGSEDTYITNKSIWGVDYTLARPLIDSNGKHFAILCADVDIAEINTSIYRNIFINIFFIVDAGFIFIALAILWMRKNVTTPLKKLENYVTQFAETSSGKRDPDELQYIPPEIHTENEVESLANAYAKLSNDMRDYVISIAEAEKETKGLKEHVSEINAIAYKDGLTHVKNKNAYEEKKMLLEKELKENGSVEFGIVMADVNSLKAINDLYGHDKGDEFIKGACKIICDTYSHSSIYRIGGDEFVVLLQGRDYANRDHLIRVARDIFDVIMHDIEKKAWNRYSMALGMSVWEEGDDFDKVFSRADQNMYEEKAKIKETFKIE